MYHVGHQTCANFKFISNDKGDRGHSLCMSTLSAMEVHHRVTMGTWETGMGDIGDNGRMHHN